MIWGRGIPASAIGLNILPRQCGGPQSAVKPVSGQSGLAGLDMVGLLAAISRVNSQVVTK